MEATRLPTNLNARRLISLRTIAIPGPAICVLGASQVYDFDVRAMPLLAIIAGLVLLNIWTWRRLKSGAAISDRAFFLQMLVDVAALTGILYYSGGASNPFALFFLLPLTITATILTPAYTWAMAATTAICYSLLLVYRVPVPALLPGREQTIFGLHVAGMWLGFVMIAALISHYVVGMGETLRDRDRRLAEAREQALNNDRMIALGTLAAGAAHELSTPLGTMALLADEMADLHEPDELPELHRQVGLLRKQIARCKEALSVMSASAGVARADAARVMALDRLVEDVVDQVRALRPEASIGMRVDGERPAPALVAERTLVQALVNVLHNAVDASPDDVSVHCHWNDSTARVEILDRGAGFDPAVLEPSQAGNSGKQAGLGVGLFISRAAIDQFGGRLSMQSRAGGGTGAVIELPVSAAAIPADR